jgi:hypothetical protein
VQKQGAATDHYHHDGNQQPMATQEPGRFGGGNLGVRISFFQHMFPAIRRIARRPRVQVRAATFALSFLRAAWRSILVLV